MNNLSPMNWKDFTLGGSVVVLVIIFVFYLFIL